MSTDTFPDIQTGQIWSHKTSGKRVQIREQLFDGGRTGVEAAEWWIRDADTGRNGRSVPAYAFVKRYEPEETE